MAIFVAVFLTGCPQTEITLLPNRVLDRPLDLAIGCYRVVGGEVEALPLSSCNAETTPSCGAVTATGEGEPQLLSFITNSERNELALARRCDQEAGVVDLDLDTPGYNLLPIGRLPSKLSATAQTCELMTANVGSCDVSWVDARRLAAYGLNGARVTQPSSGLVATVTPMSSDGRPLASRPADIIAVQPRAASPDPVPPQLPGLVTGCSGDGISGSVILSFPACQLIAEVDLQSQVILQSRRFVANPDGGFTIEDAGTAPTCPTECPAQLAGFEPSLEPLDPDGYRPSALTLLPGEPPPSGFVAYDALFVGGMGGDEIFEIPIDETGTWASASETHVLTLERAEGVTAIRATPVVYMGLEAVAHQFLYVIAGDGSTRVVDRFAELDRLGIECDTQVDPSVDGARDACTPVVSELEAPIRRPSANGPGIRAPGGAAITDWTFFLYPGNSEAEPLAPNSGGGPFDTFDPQVVGVGVTTFGQVIYATLDQYQEARLHNPIDPAGIMNLAVAPHMLWPAVDPTVTEVDRGALPRVEDRAPARTQPGGEFSLQALAPSLRRIDHAYALEAASSAEQGRISAALGTPSNVDALGGSENALYEEDVVRVVARDYASWQDADWTVTWEGDIPGTTSTTGRIACASPISEVPGGGSWEGALCHAGSHEVDDPQGGPVLIDEGAAFCDRGILPGDKVAFLGCRRDQDCGLGQRCLQEPLAPTSASGICISESAYESDYDRLRVLCAPFITDPCGQTRREYLVTRAFQDELYLQALDVATDASLRRDPLNANALEELEGRFSCLSLPGASNATCYDDTYCDESAEICAPDGVCRRCSEGEPACLVCEVDADCATDFGAGSQCLDGRCRRPCESGDPECTRAPLPGPLCFPELVSYVVRAHQSFIVLRNGGGFYTDRVTTRGALAARRGETVDADLEDECVEDPTVSSFLTSRLRLGADAYGTFEDPENPHRIPPCMEDDAVSLEDPNPCQILTTRLEPDPTRFHAFEHAAAGAEPRQIPAVRFSNPSLTFTLDLVSLLDVAKTPAAFPQFPWPATASEFRRSRIPENYTESFSTFDGYEEVAMTLAIGDATLIYPVRIVPGEETYSAYIVDSGGRGGTAGVRGQVVRIEADGYVSGAITDQSFRVR